MNIKGRWHWFLTYTIPKYQERGLWFLARHAPKRVRYFMFMYELGARTTGPGVPVPERTVNDILNVERR